MDENDTLNLADKESRVAEKLHISVRVLPPTWPAPPLQPHACPQLARPLGKVDRECPGAPRGGRQCGFAPKNVCGFFSLFYLIELLALKNNALAATTPPKILCLIDS